MVGKGSAPGAEVLKITAVTIGVQIPLRTEMCSYLGAGPGTVGVVG